MKGYRSLLLMMMLSAPFSLAMAANSPDVDDVTMDVVKHNDPSEVTNDIKLPDAVEKDEQEHHAKNGDHSKDDMNEDKDHADDSKEHAAESKEQAEDSKESSHESSTESHDDVKMPLP